jgi:hypothetical protein
MRQSVFDEINGVGPARKRALRVLVLGYARLAEFVRPKRKILLEYVFPTPDVQHGRAYFKRTLTNPLRVCTQVLGIHDLPRFVDGYQWSAQSLVHIEACGRG